MYQDDGFRTKLANGCETAAQCQRLVDEAFERKSRCSKPNFDAPPCDVASADLAAADRLRQQRAEYDGEFRAQQQRQEAEAAAERQRQYELKKAAERQQLAEQEEKRRTAAVAAATARELEDEEKAAAADAAEAERLKLLGRTGRERELRACYKNAGGLCRELLSRLLAVASNESEKRALVALDQQLASRPDVLESSGTGGLRCCDGSASSCSCGGSHRGCCAHHGGVCGCN